MVVLVQDEGKAEAPLNGVTEASSRLDGLGGERQKIEKFASHGLTSVEEDGGALVVVGDGVVEVNPFLMVDNRGEVAPCGARELRGRVVEKGEGWDRGGGGEGDGGGGDGGGDGGPGGGGGGGGAFSSHL